MNDLPSIAADLIDRLSRIEANVRLVKVVEGTVCQSRSARR